MRWTSFHYFLVISVTLVASAPLPNPDFILAKRALIHKHQTPCGSGGTATTNVTSPADGLLNTPSSATCGSFTTRALNTGADIFDYGVLKRAVAPKQPTRQSARLADQARANQPPRRSARIAEAKKTNAQKAVIKNQAQSRSDRLAAKKPVPPVKKQPRVFTAGKLNQKDRPLRTKDLRGSNFRTTASGGKKSCKQADHCGELQIYAKHLNDKGYTRGNIKGPALADFRKELNSKQNSKMISPAVNQAKGRATRAVLAGKPVKPKDKALLKKNTAWKKPATELAKNMDAIAQKHNMNGVNFVAAQAKVTKAFR